MVIPAREGLKGLTEQRGVSGRVACTDRTVHQDQVDSGPKRHSVNWIVGINDGKSA